MKLFGYILGEEKISPTELCEATLLLNINEIDDMIEFLGYVKERHIYQRDHFKTKDDHTHYSDWKKIMGKPQSENDLIIATLFEDDNE